MTLSRENQRNQELKEKYFQLKETLRESTQAAGRAEDSVALLAVSKTHPITEIAAVAANGQVDFGENKVQELSEKILEAKELYPELQLRWHLIGHLQRNKVRQIVGDVYLIHSVDSLRLLKEIEKRAEQAGVVQKILLQVNVSGEESKQGFEESELAAALSFLKTAKHSELRGLMTMAPFTASSEELHKYFSRLRKILVEIRSDFPEAVELSMGMSGDFPEAIAEGATIVRIGSAIFGERHY
ncbi:MAG: YggS family pyridoxal phosphate-dependent enzyme [Eubacteriales bacterium]|nr:YggS family pyridoxal phosphate-dependent enzyme [Eubacteriales bacterium]